jgi:hypothetical protein
MLNDRHRRLLHDLERELEREDPAWTSQFKDFKLLRRDRAKLAVNIALTLMVVMAAFSLVLSLPAAVVTFIGAALTLAFVRSRL